MMTVDWDSESYPAVSDFTALPLFALYFPVLRLLLDKFVFEGLARRLIFGKNHAKLDLEAVHRRKKIIKFRESAWKCLYFFSAEILNVYLCYSEPWFTNTKYFWVGPEDQIWPDQKMKLKLKGLYMYAAGFYTYSIFALIFWETRRSDMLVTMAHHVSTVLLLVLSYMFRFARVGAVVLALHDVTDVFMEVAKMSKYSGYQRVADTFFILFGVCWTLFRTFCYPIWVLRSTSYEVLLTLDMEKHKVDGTIYYYIFNTLLFFLLIIDMYWWVLLCRMVVKLIQTGHVNDDVRSDSESDEDHED
ncbi:ASC1-like protein 1 [Punica granatum]|uniref:ASC1-like protein 1 n=1 Tax=Punica granatum TaxID=22663 RepID=A0A218XZV0_PUNGR|nr:ASC1-like protein 1 [Punica granatum]OWM90338.1 hypothetical protein CDL15_Pgr014640 [Punica granatum]